MLIIGDCKMSKEFKYEIVTTVDSKSNNECLPRYLLGETLIDAEKTFKDFESYINNISNIYSVTSGINKSEFFGEAIIALGRAKKEFNKKLGDFIPFAKFLIIDGMNEYVRENRALVKIPSYINKANIVINRLKADINSFVHEPKDILYVDNYNDYNIPDDIIEKIKYNKEILNKAAKRACITYDELLKRAEYLPLVISENDSLNELASNTTHDSLVAKIIVDNIMPSLTDEEKLIAELIMEDKNRKEIGEILRRSDDWILNRIAKIKRKVTKNILVGG